MKTAGHDATAAVLAVPAAEASWSSTAAEAPAGMIAQGKYRQRPFSLSVFNRMAKARWRCQCAGSVVAMMAAATRSLRRVSFMFDACSNGP